MMNTTLSIRSERGAVLVVSLVFLLVLTVIGVAAMQNTSLEEKMAGNVKDRNLAFQNAESGIREAERFIDNVTTLTVFDGSDGLYGEADIEPDIFIKETWVAEGSTVQSEVDYAAYQAPRYYIKQFQTVSGVTGALNLGGYGDNKGGGDVTIFNITARGTGGGEDSAEVLLRSYYGRVF